MAGDWLDGNGNGAAVDPHELIDDVCTKALLDVVSSGALLGIGTTSDGGALHVTVTVDGRFRREYFRSTDELRVWLAEATAFLADRTPSSPSTARQSRSRRPQTR